MRNRFALAVALLAGALLVTAPATAGPVGAATGKAEVTSKAAETVGWRRHHRRHFVHRHHHRHRYARFYGYGYSPYYYRPYYSSYYYQPYYSSYYYRPHRYHRRPHIGIYLRF